MFQEMLQWLATMLQIEFHFLLQAPVQVAFAIGVGAAAGIAIHAVWKNR